MPGLLEIVFIVLIGYPIVQLLSVLAVRGSRVRLNELLREIRANPAYSAEDLRILEWTVLDDGIDSLLGVVALPVIAPFMTLTFAWEVLTGRLDPTSDSLEGDISRETRALSELMQEGSSSSPLWSNSSFKEARSLSIDINLKRMPLTLCLLFVGIIIPMPLVLFAYGLRQSTEVIAYFFRKIVVTNRLLIAGADTNLASARIRVK